MNLVENQMRDVALLEVPAYLEAIGAEGWTLVTVLNNHVLGADRREIYSTRIGRKFS